MVHKGSLSFKLSIMSIVISCLFLVISPDFSSSIKLNCLTFHIQLYFTRNSLLITLFIPVTIIIYRQLIHHRLTQINLADTRQLQQIQHHISQLTRQRIFIRSSPHPTENAPAPQRLPAPATRRDFWGFVAWVNLCDTSPYSPQIDCMASSSVLSSIIVIF